MYYEAWVEPELELGLLWDKERQMKMKNERSIDGIDKIAITVQDLWYN